MSTYAIVETGSKQYRVEPQTVFEVELLPVEEKQKEITIERVLLLRKDDQIHVGTPLVQGAKVICEFLGEFRGPKVVSYKFRRKNASRRIRGHRQNYLRLKVKEIKL